MATLIQTVYYREKLANSQSGLGTGTADDPYAVEAGSDGITQLNAFLDAIENTQGTRPATALVGRSPGTGASGMRTWKAQNGSDSGIIGLTAAETKTYLDERYLADPCTKTTGYLGTGTSNCRLYAVGSDLDNGEVVVYTNNDDVTLNIVTESGSDFSITLNQGGPNTTEYPTALLTVLDDTNGGDDDTMYDPRAAIVDDGLVVLFCRVHDWDQTTSPDNQTTRQTASNWDQQNRVALVWKKIGDSSWNVVDDDTNAYAGTLGQVWMVGRPIRPTSSSLMFGFTTYANKNASNGENRAYVSRFTRSGDVWSHAATVEILSDADAAIADQPGEQHFHSVALHRDGARLRAFVFIGDGSHQNGIFECSRSDTDIADDATTKTGFVIKDATASSSWTRQGFVHGGQTDLSPLDSSNDVYRDGAQPTWGIVIGGRMHCGSDEAVPAIYSFDVSGDAGSALNDAQGEYLPHSIDYGTGGYVYTSLVADSSNYDGNGTARHAAIVRPSEADYASTTKRDNGTRVAYHNGAGWATIAQRPGVNQLGIGVAPNGSVVAGTTDSGLIRIEPGASAAYTPLVSSKGATNIMQGTTSVVGVLGRTSVSSTTGDTTTVASLTADHDVHTITSIDDAGQGAVVARITIGTSDLDDTIDANDIVVVRGWMKGNTSGGVWVNFAGQSVDAAHSYGTAPASPSRLIQNTWHEFQLIYDTTGSGASGEGIRLTVQTKGNTSVTPNAYSEVSIDIAIEGVYLNPGQPVLQRPALSDSLLDTDLTWTFANDYPIVVRGCLHPLGGTDYNQAYTGNPLLFRLYSDATNYIDFTADYVNDRVTYTSTIGGVTGSATEILGSIEFITGAEFLFHIARNGDELDLGVSYMGNPYTTVTTSSSEGVVEWSEIRQEGDSDAQGELMVAEVVVGELLDEYRARNRGRVRG